MIKAESADEDQVAVEQGSFHLARGCRSGLQPNSSHIDFLICQRVLMMIRGDPEAENL